MLLNNRPVFDRVRFLRSYHVITSAFIHVHVLVYCTCTYSHHYIHVHVHVQLKHCYTCVYACMHGHEKQVHSPKRKKMQAFGPHQQGAAQSLSGTAWLNVHVPHVQCTCTCTYVIILYA